VKVDYADFLRWGGHTYTSAASFGPSRLAAIPTATTADLGPDVFTVKCSLARWNDLTDAMPVAADGDAAFLASGTTVAAMKGWPTECPARRPDCDRIGGLPGRRPERTGPGSPTVRDRAVESMT
jgi:hypothetical protein